MKSIKFNKPTTSISNGRRKNKHRSNGNLFQYILIIIIYFFNKTNSTFPWNAPYVLIIYLGTLPQTSGPVAIDLCAASSNKVKFLNKCVTRHDSKAANKMKNYIAQVMWHDP